MNYRNITVANALYNTFSNAYLVENRGITDNLTETDEKTILLPLFAESIAASKALVGEHISQCVANQALTGSGIQNDTSALIKVLEHAIETFIVNYNFSTAKLFTSLSASPVILYQLCLLIVDEFYRDYRVDPIQYGCVIVDLYEEEAKREEARKEEARIQKLIDDWKKAESDYTKTLDNCAMRAYFADKAAGFLPESLREAYSLAKPYLKH